MATTDLAKLVVTLEAQNALFMRKLEQSEKKVSRFEKRNKSMVMNVKKAMLGLGALFSLRALNTMLVRSIENMDKLAKTSDKLGILPEKLAGLRHAADLTGVATTTLDMAVQRYTRRVAEAAQGTGEAKNAIKELGLDAAELSKLPLDQQLQVVADRMNLVERQSDKVRLAMKLFDSEGVALVNTLALGSEGLQRAQQDAEKLGIALDRDTLRQAERAKDSITRLGGAGSGLAMTFTGQMAPAIEIVANWLTALSGQEGGLTTVLNLAKFLAEEVAAIVHGPAIGDLVRLQEELGKLDERLTNLKAGGAGAYSGSFGPFDEYIASLEAQREKLQKMLDLTNQIENKAPALSAGGTGGAVGGEQTLLGAGDNQNNGAFFDNLFGTNTTAIVDYYNNLSLAREETEKLKELHGTQQWLQEFWQGGFASYEQYLDSLGEAPKKTDAAFQEMSVYAEQAARNMQDSFADGLFASFKGETSNMLQVWRDTLLQMVAQAASAKIFDKLGGFFKSNQGSGGVLGAVASFAGMFDGGGNIPAGKFGLAAEKRDEFAHIGGVGYLIPGPAQITGGAETARMMQGQARGGNVEVKVINKAGVSVRPTVSENNGQTTVELMVETMKSAIANGHLDPAFETSFGLNRANGGR